MKKRNNRFRWIGEIYRKNKKKKSKSEEKKLGNRNLKKKIECENSMKLIERVEIEYSFILFLN